VKKQEDFTTNWEMKKLRPGGIALGGKRMLRHFFTAEIPPHKNTATVFP